MRGPATVMAFLLGITILAGCVGVPGGDDGLDRPADAPPAGASPAIHRATGATVNVTDLLLLGEEAAEGARIWTGFNAFEPTIGVTKDGVLFKSQFSPTPHVSRSTDQGETWELVTFLLPTDTSVPPQSNDPYVYVDMDTGRVFSMDLQALVCSWLTWSDDLGESWATNPLGCGHPVGVHDHQTMVTAKPRMASTLGYDNILYYCVNRVADSVCATSLNGGVSFGPLIPVFQGADLRLGGGGSSVCGGLHGHAASAPDGTVYLPKGQCGYPMVGKTVDDGLTWTRHLVDGDVGTQGHEVRAAVDADGNLFVFWMSRDGIPYLSISRDAAETWTPPMRVAPPEITAADFPAVAAGDAGRVTFAYVATDVEGGYEAVDDDTLWHAYIGVIADAFADDPVIQTVQITNETEPVTVGTCGRIRCPGIGDFIDVVIDMDGRPWAAFVDGCSGQGAVNCDRTTIGPSFVGTLLAGPALRGPAAPLPPLPYTP